MNNLKKSFTCCFLIYSVYYDPFLAAAATADSNYRLQVIYSLMHLLTKNGVSILDLK